MRWFITVIECLHPSYSLSRAGGKKGPINSQPRKISPFPLSRSHPIAYGKGAFLYFSGMCHTISGGL